MLLSLYRVEQHYGGPEEGGWYYTTYTFVKVVFRGSPKQRLTTGKKQVVVLGWSWNGKKYPARVFAETQAHRLGWDAHDGHVVYFWEKRARENDNSNRQRPRYE